MAGRNGGTGRGRMLVAIGAALAIATGCTIHHSKVPLSDGHEPRPPDDATFVTEDDSGLALLGIFALAEPDHYAVLIERARRRHNCDTLTHIQLDFYTDFWLFVGFPIARITAICHRADDAATPSPAPTPVR